QAVAPRRRDPAAAVPGRALAPRRVAEGGRALGLVARLLRAERAAAAAQARAAGRAAAPGRGVAGRGLAPGRGARRPRVDPGALGAAAGRGLRVGSGPAGSVGRRVDRRPVEAAHRHRGRRGGAEAAVIAARAAAPVACLALALGGCGLVVDTAYLL